MTLLFLTISQYCGIQQVFVHPIVPSWILNYFKLDFVGEKELSTGLKFLRIATMLCSIVLMSKEVSDLIWVTEIDLVILARLTLFELVVDRFWKDFEAHYVE